MFAPLWILKLVMIWRRFLTTAWCDPLLCLCSERTCDLSLSINLPFLPLPWAVNAPLLQTRRSEPVQSRLHVGPFLLSNENQINSIFLFLKRQRALVVITLRREDFNHLEKSASLLQQWQHQHKEPHQQKKQDSNPVPDRILFLFLCRH